MIIEKAEKQCLVTDIANSGETMTNQEQLESFYDSEGFLMIDSFNLDEASPDNRGMSL